MDDETEEEQSDHISTRIICRTFRLDGFQFSWWAVDEGPALVTATNQWFGSKNAVTHGDVETKARDLAAQILEEQKEQVQEVAARLEERAARRTVK